MNNTTDSAGAINSNDAERAPRSRKPLLIMLVVSVFPMIGAYFVFFTGIGMPNQTVNAGKFIDPALSVETLVGDVQWQTINENKRWHIIIPVSYPCNERCQENLFTTRQVHIRLDQRSGRLDRYALFSDAMPLSEREAILAEHPGLKVIDIESTAKNEWFEKLNLPTDLEQEYYLLADQEGRAMMAYDSRQHGNDVLKDLKRAIKYSIDYQ